MSLLITRCRILTNSCSRLARQAEAKIRDSKLGETQSTETV